MLLTRDIVGNAIKDANEYLQRSTAAELSTILNVPLSVMIACLRRNHKHIVKDSDNNIKDLVFRKYEPMSPERAWIWFVANRNNGSESNPVMAYDQAFLAKTSQSIIKWNHSFSFAVCSLVNTDKTPNSAVTYVRNIYGEQFSNRVKLLGVIHGVGVNSDKYLYGIVLTESEIARQEIYDKPIFNYQWILEANDKIDQDDWFDVGYITGETKNEVQKTPEVNEKEYVKVNENGRPTRRTLEELNKHREEMIQKLVEYGYAKEVATQSINSKAKIGDADAIFEVMMRTPIMKNVNDLKQSIRVNAGMTSQPEPIEKREEKTETNSCLEGAKMLDNLIRNASLNRSDNVVG